jgi:aspartyl protease family protein
LSSGTRHLISQALIWTGSALAVAAGLYFHDDLTAALTGRQVASAQPELSDTPQPASARDQDDGTIRISPDARGNYLAQGRVDGHPVDFMVDTGATLVVLSFDDAERSGIDPQRLDFSGRAQTANGISKIAHVKLDSIDLGGITLHDIPAAVAAPGAMRMNLLGMSFLSRLTHFEIHGSDLYLTR